MSNLEAAITLKASVEQFAAGINSAVQSFTGGMSQIQGAAQNTGSKTEQALEKIGIRRHAEIEAEIAAVEDAYRQLAESGELSGRELAQASLKMRERVRELHEETNSWMSSLGMMKGELLAAGAALYGIGRVLQGAAAESMRFGTAMAEVSTLLDDTTGLEQTSEAVRRLTREYGGDATANAKALYDVISAGAADSAEAIETLTAANKLAVGGVTEVKIAADGLTSTMNAYGVAAGSVTQVSDAFFVAVKAGKTTVAELASSIGQVAPIASEAGVGLEELLASVATLTAGGVKTSEAMTQIRGALTGIIKPTAEAAELAEKLGLQFNIGALKAKGWAGFLEDVQAATGGNIETMGQLFGSVEGLAAVLTLTGRGVEKFGDTLQKMQGKAGETEKAVAKMMDTPAKRVELFQAAMRDLGLSLGDAVSAFTPLLTAVADLVNNINELPGPLKTTVVGLGAAVIAAGPLVVALGSLAKAWGILRLALVGATAGHYAHATATAVNSGAVTAHTRALGANAKAATGAAGALTTLGKVLRGTLMVAAAAAAFEIVGLVSNLINLYQQTQKLKDAETEAAATKMRLAERYREISEATGVAVSSTEEFTAAVKAGKLVYDEATNAWISGAAALEKTAAAAREAAVSAEELAKREWGAQVRQAGELADALAQAAAGGKGATESVAQLVGGIDLLDPAAVLTVVKAMDMLEASGSRAAKEVGTELVNALAKVSAVDLGKLSVKLTEGFAAGKISAEEFARVNDEILSESLRRLGVNAATALGRVSPAVEEAVDTILVLDKSLQDAGESAEQTSIALEMAAARALAMADSVPALEAVMKVLQGLGQHGRLGAEDLERLVEKAKELKGKVEDLTPGVQSLEEDFRRLGVTSQAELERAASVAKASFDRIRTSGKATERELRESFQAYATAAIAANEGVADKTLIAQARLYDLAIEADETGKSIVVSMDDAKKAVDKVAESSDSAASSMRGIGDAAAAAAGAVQSSAQAAGQSVGDFAQGARVEFLSAIDMLSNHASEALKIAERIYEAALLRGKSIEAAYKMARRAAREYIAEMEEIEAREERAARRRERRERHENGGGIPTGGTGQIRAPGAGARPPGWSEPPPPGPEPERPAPQPPRLPPPPPPTQPTPPGNVTINIAGILDVHDRATLDGLARKLQPVLAELLRKGVR